MRLTVFLLALLISSLLPTLAQASLFSSNSSSSSVSASANPFASSQNIPTVDEAMPLTVEQTSAAVELTFQLMDHVYLYRPQLKLVLKDANGDPVAFKAAPSIPEGTPHEDAVYGKTQVYFQRLHLSIPFSSIPSKAASLQVSYQGCLQDKLCYPPEQKDISLNWPTANGMSTTTPNSSPIATGPGATSQSTDAAATNVATGDSDSLFTVLSSADANLFASWAASQSLPYVLLLFFLGGLLMAFTPCVFPMFPILLGILAGSRRPSPARGFVVSLAYVLGMAVPYTLAGLVVALFGAQFNIQAWLQQPAAIIVAALIFGVLALAMFGVFELQLPARLRDRLGTSSNGGSVPQAIVIGAISGLIVSPCITPVLAGALLFVAAQGQVASGALALFVLSLGMGVPLLIIGAGGASLLPRAGGFMDDIKRFFGLVLLLVGTWLLSRLLTPTYTLWLYGIVLGVFALVQGALDPSRRLRQAIYLLVAFYAGLLMLGAAAGGSSPLTPLKPYAAIPTVVAASASAPTANNTGHFETVAGNQLAAELAAAKAANEPVLVDFFAEWCTACKELDRTTLSDPKVLAAMQHLRLLRVDITDINDANRQLMQRYRIIGLPALVFFAPNGNEINSARVLGYMNSDQWLTHLKKRVFPAI